MAITDVFISFQRMDGAGKPTRSAQLAAQVAEYLRSHGVLVQFGDARKSDGALQTARVLIVVGVTVQSICSDEVRTEWEAFLNDVLCGKHSDGEVICYVDELEQGRLPFELQQCPFFTHQPHSLRTLLEHVATTLNIAVESVPADIPGDVRWLLSRRDAIAALNRAVPDRTGLMFSPAVAAWFGLVAVQVATAWNRGELTIQPGPAPGSHIEAGQWEQAFLTHTIHGEDGGRLQLLLLTPERNRFAIHYAKLSALMNSEIGSAMQTIYGMPDHLRQPTGPEEIEWCGWLSALSAA